MRPEASGAFYPLVWGLSLDPHCNGLNGKLENVLKRSARFMTRNYSRETGCMTGIFEELKWEILQLRKGGRIIGPYYCKKVCEVKSDDLIQK